MKKATLNIVMCAVLSVPAFGPLHSQETKMVVAKRGLISVPIQVQRRIPVFPGVEKADYHINSSGRTVIHYLVLIPAKQQSNPKYGQKLLARIKHFLMRKRLAKRFKEQAGGEGPSNHVSDTRAARVTIQMDGSKGFHVNLELKR